MARNLKSTRKSQRPFGFETMESRQMMAADVSLIDGGATLRIIGTEAADTATVRINSVGRVEVATSFLGTRTFSPTGITKVQFHGLGGADTLNASAMRIRVDAYGDGGNDALSGGSAGDNLFGGRDNDELNGNGGNDKLDGNDGVDVLNGQDHDDLIYGGDGNDLLNGGNGADQLYGQSGDDALIGDGEYGLQLGLSQNDRLFGGAGRDWLWGGFGADILDGGVDTVKDTMYGGNDGGKGPARDEFRLHFPASSLPYEPDQIMDFEWTDVAVRYYDV